MNDGLMWAIALTVTSSLTILGLLIASFRNLNNKITTGDEKLGLKIDDVKDRYVRRDDLQNHLKRIDATLHALGEEIKQNHEKTLQAIMQMNSK